MNPELPALSITSLISEQHIHNMSRVHPLPPGLPDLMSASLSNGFEEVSDCPEKPTAESVKTRSAAVITDDESFLAEALLDKSAPQLSLRENESKAPPSTLDYDTPRIPPPRLQHQWEMTGGPRLDANNALFVVCLQCTRMILIRSPQRPFKISW